MALVCFEINCVVLSGSPCLLVGGGCCLLFAPLRVHRFVLFLVSTNSDFFDFGFFSEIDKCNISIHCTVFAFVAAHFAY